MARRTKTQDIVRLARDFYGSLSSVASYTRISPQRLHAIADGRGRPPTRSEIARISAYNRATFEGKPGPLLAPGRSPGEIFSLRDIAKLTGADLEWIQARSRGRNLIGAVRDRDGRLIPLTRYGKPLPRLVGYSIRNTRTGEISFYWGDADAFYRQTAASFKRLYDHIDWDVYDIEIYDGEWSWSIS